MHFQITLTGFSKQLELSVNELYTNRSAEAQASVIVHNKCLKCDY